MFHRNLHSVSFVLMVCSVSHYLKGLPVAVPLLAAALLPAAFGALDTQLPTSKRYGALAEFLQHVSPASLDLDCIHAVDDML